MGKSSKKSIVEVAPPAVLVPSSKSAKKAKRDAEVALEKPMNLKKQKKEIKGVQENLKDNKKSKKTPPRKKIPESNSSEDTSSDSKEVVKVSIKKVGKHVKHQTKDSSSSEESSSDEETKIKSVNASKKKPGTVVKNGTALVPKKREYSNDDSDSDSSSDEENKTIVPMKKTPATISTDSDSDEDRRAGQRNGAVKMEPHKIGASDKSSSEASDSESDGEKVTANVLSMDKKPSAKVTLVTAAVKKEDSSSESDSEGEEVALKASVSTKKNPVETKKKDESSDSSENDSDSDENETPAAASNKKPPATEKKLQSKAKIEECSEDSSDESDDEPQRKKLKVPETNGVNSGKSNPKAAKEESSSEEDEEDTSEESSDEEPPKQTKVQKKSGSDETSTEEDSSEEESEDEHPMITPAKKMKDASSAIGTIISQKSEKQGGKTPASCQSVASGSKILFVGNLSYDVSEDDVMEFFKDAGEVVSIRLAKTDDGQFKGFGHVEFATTEAAQKSISNLNGQELMGRAVRLDFARERGSFTPHKGNENRSFQKDSGGQSLTIFVRGFNKSLQMDQIQSSLEEHFGSCGEITRVSLPRDYDTGGSKGVAYMDFKNKNAFSKALELNGSELGGSSLLVEEARPKGDGRDGGGRGGGRGGRDGGGWGGGRGGGRGRGDGGRGGGRGRGGRGGAPKKQSASTPSQGKKTTFRDD